MHIVNVAIHFLVSAFRSRLLLLTLTQKPPVLIIRFRMHYALIQLHTGAAGFIA